MAKQDINTLKNWFKTGLKPVQQHFWDWLDSFRHLDDDIPIDDVNGLQNALDSKIGDAPVDGNTYIRKDAAWVNGSQISNKPIVSINSDLDPVLSNINYLVDASLNPVTSYLPLVTTGDTRRYYFTLASNVELAKIIVTGGVQKISGLDFVIMEDLHDFLEDVDG